MKVILKRKLAAAVFLMLFLMSFPCAAKAADWVFLNTEKASVSDGVWYRLKGYSPSEDEWAYKLQCSTVSAKKGFKTLVDDITYNAVVGANKIYYIAKDRSLYSWSLKRQKATKLKKLPSPTGTCYYEFNGIYNGKLWIMCRDGARSMHRLMAWDLKKAALSIPLKGCLTWNGSHGRYNVVSTGRVEPKKAENAVYTLKLFDKSRQTMKTFATRALPMTYAAGGNPDSYKLLEKWFVYGKQKDGCWQVRQYFFNTGKSVLLKTFKKGTDLSMIMFVDDFVVYKADGKMDFEKNRIYVKQ